MTKGSIQSTRFAIIGMSAVFPGAQDVAGFWQNIIRAKDLIREVPEHYWLKSDYVKPQPGLPDYIYTDRGGYIDPLALDVLSTGIPPNSLASTDAAQLLTLHAAHCLMEGTRHLEDEALRARTSVIIGISGATQLASEMSGRMSAPLIRHALLESGLSQEKADELVATVMEYYTPWQETSFPGLLGNVVAGRVANRLDLHGTNAVVDAACASSLAALSMGLDELALGKSDLLISGGADALNNPFMHMCFAQTGALSLSGDCRPFSDQADGTLLGEGVGLVAVKRLADAERDGDEIYAVIRGCGASSDGLSKSIYAPRAEGQSIALARAYEQAGYPPQTVGMVEAHGTATKAGDAAEFQALNAVFSAENTEGRQQWCALGSVKSQIGHTKGAAGAAGLIKSVLALHQKVLPPTIKITRPNPALKLSASPFYLNTAPRPWFKQDYPRRASVSALGFGGSNFHLTVEEYQGKGAVPARLRDLAVEIVVLSADSRTALEQKCQALMAQCEVANSFRHHAYSSQQGFDAKASLRTAIVACDEAQLASSLQRVIDHLHDGKLPSPCCEQLANGVYLSDGHSAEPLALLFPGQGSQYPGMGSALAQTFPQIRQIWEQADARFPKQQLIPSVFPLSVFSDAERAEQTAQLRQTDRTQLALAAFSLGSFTLLKALGLKPDALAGHSFGEVPALFAAGVYDEKAFFKVADVRGRFMAAQAEQGDGTMMAVIHDREAVEKAAAKLGVEVVVANINSPRQTVVSGSGEALAQLQTVLESLGARVIPLPVAAAFHSPQVAGAVSKFSQALGKLDFAAPVIPVYGCSDAGVYEGDSKQMRRRLARQLAEPVQFQQQIEQMYASGIRRFVEVGPGAVLTGLVRECLHGRPHCVTALDQKGMDGITAISSLLAELSVAGYVLDWQAWWEGFELPADPALRNKPKLLRDIDGSTVDRPYPGVVKQRAASASSKRQNRDVSQPPPVPQQQQETVSTNHQPTEHIRREQTVMGTNKHPQGQPTQQQNPTAPRPLATGEAIHHAQHALLEAQKSFHLTMMSMQENLLSAHQSYMQSITQLSTGAPLDLPPMPVRTPAAVSAPLPSSMEPMPAYTSPPPPVERVEVVPPVQVTSAKVVVTPITPAPAAAETAAPGEEISLLERFLNIVAEKTGYPKEILDLDMEMESGLGIDSIKRVEILSEVQKQAPEVGAVDATQLASLNTLRAVIDAVSASSRAEVTSENPLAASDSGPQAALSGTDITDTFLDIVAEKTGYPREVLDLDMEMESGLGIDSIKRVEILSEVQQRVASMEQLDASQLASLTTLRAVIEQVKKA